MSERKYKVGDVVRTLVDIDAYGNKLFPKGTIGIITEIGDYEDSLYPYKVDTNEDWWYYSADMIESVDEDGTPKQDPCYDTISRQAVLDIINFEDKWLLDAKGHNANTGIAFGGMRSKVSALPSITPKQEPCDKSVTWITGNDGAQIAVRNVTVDKMARICAIIGEEPCDDAISRQDVLDYIYNDLGLGDEEIGNDVERQMELERSYKYVKSLSPVNPQPKTGHWIDKFAGVYRCSCCREIIEIDIEIEHPNGITFNYCPNCGCHMV